VLRVSVTYDQTWYFPGDAKAKRIRRESGAVGLRCCVFFVSFAVRRGSMSPTVSHFGKNM
jgi:hypothetical protein